ncbi:hypothetical protein PR048_028122, partial [Dryococelus australis]
MTDRPFTKRGVAKQTILVNKRSQPRQQVSEMSISATNARKTGILAPSLPGAFSVFEIEKRGSDKGDCATHVRYAIAAKHKTLNWRAVFLLCCVYLRDLQRKHWGRGGVVVRLLASHLGEQGPISGRVAPGFSHVGIVPDAASGQRVYWWDIPFTPPFYSGAASNSPQSPSSALKPALLRAAQISSLTDKLNTDWFCFHLHVTREVAGLWASMLKAHAPLRWNCHPCSCAGSLTTRTATSAAVSSGRVLKLPAEGARDPSISVMAPAPSSLFGPTSTMVEDGGQLSSSSKTIPLVGLPGAIQGGESAGPDAVRPGERRGELLPEAIPSIFKRILLRGLTVANQLWGRFLSVGLAACHGGNSIPSCDLGVAALRVRLHVSPALLVGAKCLKALCGGIYSLSECNGRGKREIPEKTRLTSGHQPTCEYFQATPPGIEPFSPWWKA